VKYLLSRDLVLEDTDQHIRIDLVCHVPDRSGPTAKGHDLLTERPAYTHIYLPYANDNSLQVSLDNLHNVTLNI
jgi:hypothetical protein